MERRSPEDLWENWTDLDSTLVMMDQNKHLQAMLSVGEGHREGKWRDCPSDGALCL